jgi:hypothetical protein
VSSQETIEPFISPLEAVNRLLTRFDDRGVVIGGIAVNLLGKPRLTADIDVMLILSIRDLPSLIAYADAEGFVVLPENVEAFVRQTRVLPLRHAPSAIGVDISLGILPFEIEIVERSQIYTVGQLDIRLPTPEDLVILKAVANRAKDWEDIRAVIVSQSNLDWDRIESWVRQFAEVLERPELWDNLARLRPRE